MSERLSEAAWPVSRLAEALEALVVRHGLARPGAAVNVSLSATPSAEADDWLQWAAGRMGIEALPVSTSVGEIPSLVRAGGPALLRLAGPADDRVLALTGKARLLAPDGRIIRVSPEEVADLLGASHVASVRPEVERVAAMAGIAARRRKQVVAALVAERVAGEAVEGVTLLRLPAQAPFPRQFRQEGLALRLAFIVILLALLNMGELWSWSLLGGATLEGHLDRGWLAAALLLALTLLPLRLLAGWNESLFALDIGRLLKARLLDGAMKLPLDAVRRRGVGRLIGQVIESQALEGVTLGGGFTVLVGLIELMLAAWVLRHGTAPLLHPVLLALFAVAAVSLACGLDRAIARWTNRRLAMTDYLVEAMIGHRTRLAQQRPDRRDATEDAQLAGYHEASAGMDGAALMLGPVLAHGWNFAALAALVPAVAHPGGSALTPLAISLGGIILAGRALGGIGSGLAALSRARLAWRRVAELFHAGARPHEGAAFPPAVLRRGTGQSGPLLEARGLAFAHAPRAPAVIDRADLSIARGDRILVEGPSGGGKSTLAALLTGLRLPDAGLLMLGGLDRATLGEDWHRRITSAPQFHENHIFSGTLAFNLLMGRRWPASDDDLAEAEDLCRELGLSNLLDRMPGGLHQPVGETGWQLSHGERSRVFLARALLQKAEVTVLDESFGSLDPATMEQCLATTLARAETLVVIAHP